MLEITIGKCDYMSKLSNSAFNVEVLHYVTKKGVTDMRVPQRVCSGAYLNDSTKEPDCDTSEVLNCLNKYMMLTKPIIIFNSIHITRELNTVEKQNREVLEKFFKANLGQPKVEIGNTYLEIERFKEALKLLKDKEAINKLLPVNVESIAFIEMEDTEGDFILKQEAEYVDTWEAINKNKFNIYKLW